MSRIPRGCVDWNVSSLWTTLNFCVASHADAWIEINRLNRKNYSGSVASHADAWIEIHSCCMVLVSSDVASHADAWIEIHQSCRALLSFMSHPTRMRGLKYTLWTTNYWISQVASHADAWIEIIGNELGIKVAIVASHADAWIEILLRCQIFTVLGSRIPRGCVDWNTSRDMHGGNEWKSHPTRMRGLKLMLFHVLEIVSLSHPTRMRGLK